MANQISTEYKHAKWLDTAELELLYYLQAE